jgi:hypothetical protein
MHEDFLARLVDLNAISTSILNQRMQEKRINQLLKDCPLETSIRVAGNGRRLREFVHGSRTRTSFGASGQVDC